ncbi:hypothetical protein NBRC3257_0154 [Gluconobacter thailandicus NBRC 3257]|uniref:Uncharacterized protein n=1 Tax=Gluconobacter thailandicus NBRC 3257 TaxID=1381097 RepID=A0ABQ0ISM6_GLUTH|nr:hypothetical protein B932_2404 [Gluconobacter oxydans H24]GAC88399.1 hypothetical protein NBRC3255_2060 [Gluconobacter thailandicus NBRC 3255]GAD25155.1 hypothetical protein NBRC3257_0154 [Gluconobacter thailandicus NBRC 3257]
MECPQKRSGADGRLQALACCNNFTSIVMAAVAANVMRALQLTAVRAFSMCLCLQGMVAATHTSTGRRGLSFGDGHGFYASFCFCVGTLSAPSGMRCPVIRRLVFTPSSGGRL